MRCRSFSQGSEILIARGTAAREPVPEPYSEQGVTQSRVTAFVVAFGRQLLKKLGPLTASWRGNRVGQADRLQHRPCVPRDSLLEKGWGSPCDYLGAASFTPLFTSLPLRSV